VPALALGVLDFFRPTGQHQTVKENNEKKEMVKKTKSRQSSGALNSETSRVAGKQASSSEGADWFRFGAATNSLSPVAGHR
jgi:hypothetical protein